MAAASEVVRFRNDVHAWKGRGKRGAGRSKDGGRGQRRVQHDMESACANPSIDYARLLSGTDHRHTCERVRRACLFNGTIVSADPGSADAAHAAAVARRLRVRDMWESGQAITSAPCVHGLTPSPAPKQVKNVGEEGFGYLSWIVERWESLPPCASILL